MFLLRSLATRSRLAAFSATRAPLLRTASLCDSANRPRQFDPLLMANDWLFLPKLFRVGGDGWVGGDGLKDEV